MGDGPGDYLRAKASECNRCKGNGGHWVTDYGMEKWADCQACRTARDMKAAPKSDEPRATVYIAPATTPEPMRVDLFPGDRKAYPVLTAALMYFPHAFAELAKCSALANEQHNPGQPVHWDYSKSIGDGNELLRHLMDSMGPEPVDAEGVHHDVKVLWRAAETVERRVRRERGLDGPAKPAVPGAGVTVQKGSPCTACVGTGGTPGPMCSVCSGTGRI